MPRERGLKRQRSVSPLPAAFGRWFDSRGWVPHDYQLQMIEAARRGRHALLVAPTGGGKTLAGFLPSLMDLSEAPRDGLHTVYVSPLKALAVDIARNLETPVCELDLPLSCETRTGDTPSAKRARQRRRPPHLLLTTPESLSLMLSYTDAARVFASTKCIIVDELHAFAPSKRGQLLALALARLQRLAPGCRRVGLSATIRDEEAFRRWLAPRGNSSLVDLFKGTGGAEPRIDILAPNAHVPWSGHMARHALPEVYQAIKARRTTLVFVNTRSIAERVFQDLWRLNDDNLEIALHHGSLGPEQRRKVEAAMAAGRLRAVVCTSSLDLGIDWGDVDLVVQIGAPKGASRLLQRIGRANHRLDQPSEALLVPANRFEYLECHVARDAVAERDLDSETLGRGALDVLAQHVLGMACSSPFHPDELYDEVREAWCYNDLSRSDFDDTLRFVESGGYALSNYSRYRRIEPGEDGRYHPTSRRVSRQYRMNAGTIVSAPTLSVRFRRGRRLGEVEESFALGLVPGDTFAFAGRLLAFQGIEQTSVIVTAAKSKAEPRVPMYAGGRLPLTTNLADRVRRLFDRPDRWTEFPEAVREWLHLQALRSVLPGPEGLLVETFPRGGGRNLKQFLVAYCYEGRNAHQTLGMLLTRRMEKQGLAPLGFVATDYVVAVWSVKPVTNPDPLFSIDILEDELMEWIGESTLIKRSFYNVAEIAGLIERRHPGFEKTGRQMTFSSDTVYNVLRQYEPDHLLLRAAWADAKGQLTDLDRLAAFLNRIAGRIDFHPLDRVSPLAVPALLSIGREQVADEGLEALLMDDDGLIEEAMRID